MRLGGQTVTFVSITESTTKDRYGNPELDRSVAVPVANCRFRPLSAKEEIDAAAIHVGEIVNDPWRCTAPPVAAVLAAKSKDEVICGGVTYQIVGGPRVFPGPLGAPFKVTIICRRVDG